MHRLPRVDRWTYRAAILIWDAAYEVAPSWEDLGGILAVTFFMLVIVDTMYHATWPRASVLECILERHLSRVFGTGICPPPAAHSPDVDPILGILFQASHGVKRRLELQCQWTFENLGLA